MLVERLRGSHARACMAASKSLSAPRAAVGVLVVRGSEVLLVLRANAPAKGSWAVPGGSIALGESLQEAAEREVREETGVEVRGAEVVHAFDVIERDAAGAVLHHYVVVDVRAEWVAGEPRAGDDALDARWQPIGDLRSLPISGETLRLIERLRS
jgi:ADP-ribose pyrophosphatase